MKLKLILGASLMLLLMIGLITLSYTVYVIRGDISKEDGATHLNNHITLIYTQFLLEVLQLLFGGALMYIVNKDIF